ncbi:Theileria-specific sub-telomeric protein, SVSP family member, putative [Theileria annulata]|uniref:Theileria-specific sub-telomeric protein, SVSP family member, putative n=1 Tax=Theileria annulata TaxID=5874 RepID=Q4U8D4_THEAN|nr:Theileria-specific sub-telomeric protein, SVSP family member, putative [Theileria annulata]CAI76919.1 Theileria-specific sub-telomeric protein, SVSP family member, putative [Theileria annulata]|eukprot:XP_953544.1 Theileria-specific sub-telomeric protein, SVSP family member, putative [Theileria annulata]
MYICFAYTYTLILLLIGYSGCSDKPTNTQGSNSNEDNLPQIGGISLVDYSDSDDEDNFQVTETQEEQTEEITEVLDETHTEETSETDVLDETQPEPETTQVLTETETQTEPVKDVETQTDLEQPEPQTEPEPDDNQIKEKLHVLYYVPPPQEPYGIYQQIVAIPPIKPLPPPVPGESPKYYLISAEQNKYGEHETIPVTYMEYKPILQPVLYYEPIIGPQTYPPMQYPSVSYPVVIPPPIQPTQLPTITKESPQQPSQQPSQETSQETSQPETPQQPTRIPRQPTRIPRQRTHPKEHKPIHPNIRPRIKILRRTTQTIQPPTKEASNIGPGILGPAPGPLRDPSQLLEEFGLLQDKLTTEDKPSHLHISRPIKILRRPTTQETTQPTETTKQTDEPTTHAQPQQPAEPSSEQLEPTQQQQGYQPQPQAYYPVPTTESNKESTHTQHTQEPQEPTQPSPQHTQYTTEPSGLEPETIPVEVGSDEEEEPPKPPSGPGDGDQPPDGPEEGPEDEGDEDEEENEEEKKPSKVVKKCKQITFMKKNEEGELIEMIEGDYEIKYEIQYQTRYEFLANLEELHCDDEIVFQHRIGNKYCKVLVYNYKNTTFLIILENSYVFVSCDNGIFKTNVRRIIDCLKIYTIDSIGNEVQISEKDYKLRITKFKWFMIKFNNGIKCHKIVFKNMLVWEKTNYDNYPIALTINVNLNVVVIFKQYSKTFLKRGRKYVLQYIKTYKTN